LPNGWATRLRYSFVAYYAIWKITQTNIFKRINDLPDRAEELERMVKQTIREIEERILRVREGDVGLSQREKIA